MNKLITTDIGGFPFTLNDIRFQDEAYRLAFSDILTSIVGEPSAVLYGCTITPGIDNIYSVAEGAIFYNNEVWHVDAHTYLYDGGVPQWHFIAAWDVAGSKTFYNGQQKQTYQRRHAIVSVETPAGAIASVSIYELLGRIDTLNRKSLAVSHISPFTAVPGLVNRIWKVGRIATMQLALRGGITQYWEPAAQLSGTLPYWPLQGAAIAKKIDDDIVPCAFSVDAAGVVSVRHFLTVSLVVDLYIHISFEAS